MVDNLSPEGQVTHDNKFSDPMTNVNITFKINANRIIIIFYTNLITKQNINFFPNQIHNLQLSTTL